MIWGYPYFWKHPYERVNCSISRKNVFLVFFADDLFVDCWDDHYKNHILSTPKRSVLLFFQFSTLMWEFSTQQCQAIARTLHIAVHRISVIPKKSAANPFADLKVMQAALAKNG